MMLTKEEAKNYVKDQLEGYLCGCGIDTKKKFRCLNPAHQDSNPSMVFNPRKNKVHCFVCDRSWDMFDLLSFETGFTGNELFIHGYNMFGLHVEGYGEKNQKENKKFYITAKEAKLIGIRLPYQISVSKTDDKRQKMTACTWETFLSESQMKRMVKEKALETKLKLEKMQKIYRQEIINDFITLMNDYPDYDSDDLWALAERNNFFSAEDIAVLQTVLYRASL